MAELSNDIPKKLWDKILFTDALNPISCDMDMDSHLAYIYVDPDKPKSSYIWILPDGRLVQSDWVYGEKYGPYRPEQLVYVGEGVFHHKQRKT